MVSIADVAADELAGSARFLNPVGGLARIVIFAEIRDKQACAFFRVGYRDSLSNTAVAAGDDDPLPGQFAGPFVAFLAMVRVWGTSLLWCRDALLLFREGRFGIIRRYAAHHAYLVRTQTLIAPGT